MTEHSPDKSAALDTAVISLECEREERRRKILRQARILAAVVGASALALLLAAGIAVALTALAAGVILAVYLANRAQKAWESSVRTQVLRPVCDAMGDMQYLPVPPAGNNLLAPFEALRLVGSSNQKTLEHYFSGSHNSRRFECLHADLGNNSSKSATTPVFHGFLFKVETDSSVPAQTIIMPNVLTARRQRGRTVIELGNLAFDKTFLTSYETASADGEQLARTVVNSSMQQALLDINDRESRQANGIAAIRVGFMHDSVYIALSRWAQSSSILGLKFESQRPFLEMRFLLRARSDVSESVAAMVEDIGTVQRIINALG